MPPFWISDAVLITVQAALVLGPRPILPGPAGRMRSSVWAWVLLPVSLGGTVALLAVVPSWAGAYAWLAALGVPVLAAIALASALRSRLAGHRAWAAAAGLLMAASALTIAWAGLAWWRIQRLWR